MTTNPLERRYEWRLQLQSTPEQLWPFVADTDRLNHDVGFSAITRQDDEREVINNRRKASQVVQPGLVQTWIEEPFQWVRPYHYTTQRNYVSGILFRWIKQQVTLTPTASGTDLHYAITVLPKSRWLAPLIYRSFSSMAFEQVYRRYDVLAQYTTTQKIPIEPAIEVKTEFAEGGAARLQAMEGTLLDMGADPDAVDALATHIRYADDIALMTIQPYALADEAHLPRRPVLEACLMATRIGLLDMSWDLLCPNCRGAKAVVPTLSQTRQQVHCEVCHIDYTADFERSVELVFTPNPSVRQVPRSEYCVGGPEVTPHIIVQQLLQPGETRSFQAVLPTGRYRLRTMTLPGGQFLRVSDEGGGQLVGRATTYGWDDAELHLAPGGTLTLTNNTDDEQLFVVEHLAWSDQAVTAAEVTTRQVFRDLFSSEALRPGEQVSIGSLTIVFTDLRGSTAMYRELGDAPAFGLVMDHFRVLRAAIREEDGAIVKTIGDAVMAVFRTPAQAVRAMLQAHDRMTEGSTRTLQLRVGIHTGRCIGVTLNERLDYFGTTINLAARLEGLSAGGDVVMSSAVHADPSVSALLNELGEQVTLEAFEANVRGFDQQTIEAWRMVPARLPLADAD